MQMSDYEYIRKGGLRTKSDVKKQQDEIAAHYNLGWWYGTWCKKCCDVYPILVCSHDLNDSCYYYCEVCGRKTKKHLMPWCARDEWNDMDFDSFDESITLFQYL